jgi:tRNA A-37 threonylcarbamoyl transferase component Bud32
VSLSLNTVIREDEIFIKTYGPKTPLWRYYIRCILDLIGVKQPVEYYNKYKRLKFECQTLRLWSGYGLNVPSIILQKDTALYLSVIKGQTLSNIFSEFIDFDIVIKLFIDLNYRHILAFKYNEPRLCHIDANLRNIMYCNHKIFHIDFEMGREYETVNLWAQREVSKLLISLLRYAHSEYRDKVLDLFFEQYEFKDVVTLLIASKIKSSNNTRKNNQNSLYNLVLDLQMRMDKANEN